jgi:hypothetical protein
MVSLLWNGAVDVIEGESRVLMPRDVTGCLSARPAPLATSS